EDFLESRRLAEVQPGQPGRRLVGMTEHETDRSLVLEGRVAGQDVVKDAAQTIDVRANVGLPCIAGLLRRAVQRRTELVARRGQVDRGGPARAVVKQSATQADVEDLHRAV